MGLRNCLAGKKPLISKANKAAHLAWCLDHASWTTRDWAKVLWSDESTFTQFQQNRCSRVWREAKDKWSPSCLVPTVKHSPSRMHWGCFSRQGLGPLVPLEGSVTGVSHVETLRKYAMPTFKRRFPNGDGWFQEDNARPHTAKVAATFQKNMAYAPYLGQPKVQTSTQSRICGLWSRETFENGRGSRQASLRSIGMLRRSGERSRKI